MKFKFLCLALAVMMMLAVLTGCAGNNTGVEDIANEAKRETQTLVVYLISETEVSEQVTSDIEDAINRITKSAYKTQLDLHFFTEDKYYEAVEDKFEDKENELKKIEKEQNEKKKIEKALRESCKKAGVSYIAPTTPKQETIITEEQTLVNEEYGTIEYVYPEPTSSQLDIFYVGGYDKYMEYMYNEWLADLKEELTTTSKQLNEHINGVYMSNIDTEGGIYGIPTNSVVGEYTWMLLDKSLMDDYLFTADSINSITDENLFRFLAEVKANEKDVDPAVGNINPSNVYYWSVGAEGRLTNENSLLCGSYEIDQVIGVDSYPDMTTIFHDSNYTSQMRAIKRMEWEGYLINPDAADYEPGPAAVKFINGGYEVYAENHYDPENGLNGNYYVKMLARPRAEVDDIFAHMICVNALEDNVARSMEIVTSININSEVRNILQYGVEGENYWIDESGVLHRYNDTYMMDINKTGNVFTAHPEEGLRADYWDYAIQQNTDALIVPLFGLNLDEFTLDTESLNAFNGLYDEYMAKLNACTSVSELDAFFDESRKTLANDENYKIIKSGSYADFEEGEPAPLYAIYFQWLLNNKYTTN